MENKVVQKVVAMVLAAVEEAGMAIKGRATAEAVDLLGLRFARLTRGQVVDHVAARLAEGRGGWLLTPNTNYLRRVAADPSTRALVCQADLIVADGVPLLWAARLRGCPLPDRVAGSDLVWLLAERAARDGRSIYLLGGNPGVSEKAAERLVRRWPTLRIAGTSSPRVSTPPTREELDSVRAALEEARPDLVYVGLGVPKQDWLISALRPHFPRTWWAGIGISLSFVAGELRRAPRWMQAAGLEWLHRLAQEPRRLTRRYLVDDLPVAARLLFASWRARRGRGARPASIRG